VEINCPVVIRVLSNYFEQDVEPQLRAEIEAHLPTCAHCTAIFDGLRNTITLIGDGRSFQLPTGFSQRLRNKLIHQSHS
jgi:predicted anti-sigma-YlaC factor YlaD